jgi:hypothetical protein
MNPRRTLVFSLAATLVVGVLIGIAVDRALWKGPFPVNVIAGEAVVSGDLDAIYVVRPDGESRWDCGTSEGAGCGFPITPDLPGLQCFSGDRSRSVELGWVAIESTDEQPGPDLAVWVRCLD